MGTAVKFLDLNIDQKTICQEFSQNVQHTVEILLTFWPKDVGYFIL